MVGNGLHKQLFVQERNKTSWIKSCSGHQQMAEVTVNEKRLYQPKNVR
jgi:hypothetical protein